MNNLHTPSSRPLRIAVWVFGCLSALLAALLIVLLVRQAADKRASADVFRASEDEILTLESARESSLGRIAELETECANLKAEIAALEAERDQLTAAFEDSDDFYKMMNDKVDGLTAKIDEYEREIENLRSNIASLDTVYGIDINEQFNILQELSALLAAPVMITDTIEVTDENGLAVTDANGNKLTEEIEVEPHIALYYEDIEHGYRYEYHSDDVFDSASLIKAPFTLSLLLKASEEQEQIAEEIRKRAEAGIDEPYEPELLYDFSQSIIYTQEEYAHPGSGKIIECEDGTEFTYLELIQYLLRYSDNVAYAVLRSSYDIGILRSYVREIGAVSMYQSLSNMSAADAGLIMKKIYEFTESDAAYASLMKEAMIGSAHSVIIPQAVSPKKTAHKYGWDTDAYHDAAIVYDANPYVIAIMTDYDQGGAEVNEYLRSLAALIDRLHTNFYKVK